MMKISTMIIGLILVSLFAGVFSLFYANVGDEYNPPASFNSTEYEVYQQFSALSNQSDSLKENVQAGLGEQSGAFDKIRALMSSGFSVLSTTWASFGIMNSLTVVFVEKLGLGSAGALFFKYLPLIIIVIFVFILISVLVGRDT